MPSKLLVAGFQEGIEVIFIEKISERESGY